VISVREEAGDVDVALLAAAEIDRLLADAFADHQQPAAIHDRSEQHQRTTSRATANHRGGHFPGCPHPVPFSPLHPVNPDDIPRCGGNSRFHLVLIRITTGYKPDEMPRATIDAARPPTSARMTEETTLESTWVLDARRCSAILRRANPRSICYHDRFRFRGNARRIPDNS